MSAVNPEILAFQDALIEEQKRAVDAALKELRKALLALERLDFDRALTFTGANFYAGMLEKVKREYRDVDREITVITGMRKITIHAAEVQL